MFSADLALRECVCIYILKKKEKKKTYWYLLITKCS